jgi:hypothetical protein
VEDRVLPVTFICPTEIAAFGKLNAEVPASPCCPAALTRAGANDIGARIEISG